MLTLGPIAEKFSDHFSKSYVANNSDIEPIVCMKSMLFCVIIILVFQLTVTVLLTLKK